MRSDRTYEELKLDSDTSRRNGFHRSDRTYEELKPTGSRWSWSREKRSSDRTYEELKPNRPQTALYRRSKF